MTTTLQPATLAPRLRPDDLYRLRQAHIAAERRALEARLAANDLQSLLLRLEARYRLLGRAATVDVHTGAIRDDASDARGDVATLPPARAR